MKRLRGSLWGVTALLAGAAASGACGGQAIGEEGGGAGAETGGPGGMAGLGGRGGRSGGGGRSGQGGTAMAGASGRGGSAAGGQGAGGSVSTGGNAGVAGASMGGASGAGGDGSCAAPIILGPEADRYFGHVERSPVNDFDVCPGNGPEEVLRWTPPRSGRYSFDTFGSLFDTVLYVSADLGCAPTAPNAQQDCHDDVSDDYKTSLLGVQAVAGQDMLIVVDSYNSTGGDFTLNIRSEAECPIYGLEEQLGDALYSTFELGVDARLLPGTAPPGCRGGPLGLSFTWRAPLPGVYSFNTTSTTFPAVIALRASCAGEFLSCDDEGDINDVSEVTVTLVQGEEVVIEVTPEELEPLVSFGQLVLNIHRL